MVLINSKIRLILKFLILNTFIFYPLETYSDYKIVNQNNIEQSNIETKSNIQKNLYLLGPGDTLGLSIYGLEDYATEIPILNDGTSNIPLIGNVNVTNLTLKEAKNKIISLLSSEIIEPVIELRLISQRPIRVSVIGEISRPGLYKMKSKELNQNYKYLNFEAFTVIDALKKAGGITPDSNLAEIILKRKLPENGRYKKTTLNLIEVITKGDQINNPFIFDGDVIEVKKVDNKFVQPFDIFSTNLTPDEIKVNVIGEVNLPGQYTMEANALLHEAILVAGGPLKGTSNNKIKLVRINNNGTLVKKTYDSKFNSSRETNPYLRNGDTLIVGENLFGRGMRTLGAINNPTFSIYNIFRTIDLIRNY